MDFATKACCSILAFLLGLMTADAYKTRVIDTSERTVSATITDKEETESTVTSNYVVDGKSVFYSVEYTVNVDGQYYCYSDNVDKDFYDRCMVGEDVICTLTVNKHANGDTSYTITKES